MSTREDFENIVAELSTAIGAEIKVDETGGATFLFGDAILTIMFLPESEQILLYTQLGFIGEDANGSRRARWMLEQNDGWQSVGTFMVDPDTGVAMLADRRSILDIYSADHLAAWCEQFVAALDYDWDYFDIMLPYVDDDPDDEEQSADISIKEVEQ